jgi:ATP/ADP translocase
MIGKGVQMTREKVTTFMRWVIFMALFGMVIYQSNQIADLKHELVDSLKDSISLQQDLAETEQQYAALAKSCLK